MPNDTFFDHVTLEQATLRVRSLGPMEEFYGSLLGLAKMGTEGTVVAFGAPGGKMPLIRLTADAHAKPGSPRTAGLFHIAFLYPTRTALATVLGRLLAVRYAIEGTAFHGVSEAIYLSDPEGNGVELYVDLPTDMWPSNGGDVAMVTEEIDLGGLLNLTESTDGTYRSPGALRIGHIHLRGVDLEQAAQFYEGVLKFPVRQRDFPGALFFGRDGYHHHLAVNNWQSDHPFDPAAAGLQDFTLRLLAPGAFPQVLSAAKDQGRALADTPHSAVLQDYAGVVVKVVDGSGG